MTDFENGQMQPEGPVELYDDQSMDEMGSGVNLQPVEVFNTPLQELEKPVDMLRSMPSDDSGESVLLRPATNRKRLNQIRTNQPMGYEEVRVARPTNGSVGDNHGPEPVAKRPVWRNPN